MKSLLAIHRILDAMSIVRNVAGIAKGMSITFREMLSSPPRWRTILTVPAPCAERCLSSASAARTCCSATKTAWKSAWPASCAPRPAPPTASILKPPRTPTEDRISSSERYAKVYNIDYNRCIFCGYCVEACPTDAITHGHGFELATLNATNLVMRKEDMLVPVAALTAK